jgi:hypothetical protein
MPGIMEYINYIIGGMFSVSVAVWIVALLFLVALILWAMYSGAPGLVIALFIGAVLMWLAAPEKIGDLYIGGAGVLPQDYYIVVAILVTLLIFTAIYLRIYRR